MTIHLDTNVLVRFFTNDDTPKAIHVRTLLESKHDLIINDVVFPELEYVLQSARYDYTRDDLIRMYKFIVSRSNVSINTEVIYAIALYEKSKLDMADCLIATYSMGDSLASFDKELLKTKGIKGYF